MHRGDMLLGLRVFSDTSYSERAHQMWEVLNATYDCYMPLYEDGVDGGQIFLGGRSYSSEVDALWLGDETQKLESWA